MPTTLYLVRHGATAPNLQNPPRLQGRYQDPLLAPLGVLQAEATRDLLAARTIDHCYCSPLRRATQTAAILAAPHKLTPTPVEALTECDVGRWEGLDWATIRKREPGAYERFTADPAAFGYPEGETFADVAARTGPALDGLLTRHAGQSVLVVAHHVVNRVFLAGILGLPPGRAKLICLDNCGISVVTRAGGRTVVTTLNATFHLDRLSC